MNEQMTFDGRVVLVTGAGRGLGREYALLLAQRGARVVVNDIAEADGAPSPAHAVVDAITAAGGIAVADTHSVATPAGAAAIVQTAQDRFGRLDAVVNNAGVIHHEPITELTKEWLETTIAVNLKGAVYVTQAAWPHLTAAPAARIVNATSASGILGNRTATSYATTKAALVAFTRVLAIEGAEHDIRANTIAPLALTRMTASVAFPGWTPEQMEPRLVAPVVAWLCHEQCTMTGETLSAGGGRIARYFTSLTAGYFDEDPTLEKVRDHLDEICSPRGAIAPETPADEFDLLVAQTRAARGDAPAGLRTAGSPS